MSGNNSEYLIPAANLATLQAKVDKLAKRADRIARKYTLSDVTPIRLQVGEKVVVERQEADSVFARKRVYYKVTVVGAAPKINGWEFVATLEHTKGGTILRSVPGVDIEESVLLPYRNCKPLCVHCNVDRYRKDTYIVRNEQSDVRQVGRQCLRDYLGHQSPEHAAAIAQFLCEVGSCAEEESEWGRGGRMPEEHDLEEYLTYVATAIRHFGWVPKSAGVGCPTSAQAMDLMYPLPNTKHDNRPQVEPKDSELATQCLTWCRDHFPKCGMLSDYEHNLSVLVSNGFITRRTQGLAASLITYYQRKIGQEIARKAREQSQGISKHVGTLGKRESWCVTLERVFSYESMYGTTHLHKFRTEDGNILVWKTNTDCLSQGDYVVKGTVKKHDEYKGELQTVISRCVAEKR